MSLPPKYQDEPTSPSPNPKSYGSVPPSSSSEPLISGPSTAQAWTHQPSSDDIPDDFKVGVTVADCDTAIRLQFLRKVYSILFVQILVTCIVSVGLAHPAAKDFTREHGWIIWIPFLGSFVSLGGVYWKRHQHPANLILLGLFTLFESFMVGTITSYVEGKIVLQALFITLGVFTGLTLFTFQTKYDFSSFGPFLFAGLMGVITTGLVQIFLPFNANVDLAVAGFSVVLFSGFILYDTQQIMKRLSVDEAILASLSLYLDALNLFLSVLRVLNNTNNR